MTGTELWEKQLYGLREKEGECTHGPPAARSVKAFLPPCGLWQEPGLAGRRPGCIAFPSSPVKLLWTLAGALLDRPLWLHFRWHVGCSWREPWVLCGQGTFRRAVERTATSRPGWSVGRAFARNHGTPDPSTRKATGRSWQRKPFLWVFGATTCHCYTMWYEGGGGVVFLALPN